MMSRELTCCRPAKGGRRGCMRCVFSVNYEVRLAHELGVLLALQLATVVTC